MKILQIFFKLNSFKKSNLIIDALIVVDTKIFIFTHQQYKADFGKISVYSLTKLKLNL